MTTLSEAVAFYRICAKAEGKSPRTVSWTCDAVRYFSDFLGGDVEIDKLTVSDFRAFILALQQKQKWSNHKFTKTQTKTLSAETVRAYARAIKSFFSFLANEGLIPANPIAHVKLPKAPLKVMPTFNEKEIHKLLSQPDKKNGQGFRDYTIMLTLLDTGLRVSELCNLKLDDVDMPNGYLRVMGKGGKERYVPMGAKVTKALLKYKVTRRPDTNSDNFLVTRDGRPLVRKRVEMMIKIYGNRAGIKTRCSPHTFRSSSAVLYLRNGGDTFSLQRKLGHSTLEMTRRYSNLADADVKAQHLKYGVVDRLSV